MVTWIGTEQETVYYRRDTDEIGGVVILACGLAPKGDAEGKELCDHLWFRLHRIHLSQSHPMCPFSPFVELSAVRLRDSCLSPASFHMLIVIIPFNLSYTRRLHWEGEALGRC